MVGGDGKQDRGGDGRHPCQALAERAGARTRRLDGCECGDGCGAMGSMRIFSAPADPAAGHLYQLPRHEKDATQNHEDALHDGNLRESA